MIRRQARAGGIAVRVAAVLVMGAAGSSMATIPAPRVAGAFAVRGSDPTTATLVAALRRDLVALDAALARVPGCPTDRARAVTCTARAFADARAAYKRQEALLELLAPAAATALNGRRQEAEDDDAPPPGAATSAFAGLEAAVPALGAPVRAARPDWPAAIVAAAAGRDAVHTVLGQLGDFRVSAPLAFEAARLDIARVATLGVTGFDTPTTRAGVAESAIALRGAAALVDAVQPPNAAHTSPVMAARARGRRSSVRRATPRHAPTSPASTG